MCVQIKTNEMSNKALYTGIWLLILFSVGFMCVALYGNLIKAGRTFHQKEEFFSKFYQDTVIKKERFFRNADNGNVEMRNLDEEVKKNNNTKASNVHNVPNRLGRHHMANQLSILRRVEPVNVSSFYTMRDTKINPFDFKFLKSGKNICDNNDPPFIVALCLTTYYDIENRQTIRDTWGSIAKTGVWPRAKFKLPTVKLVFLFGGPIDTTVKQAILDDEEKRFGDVVMADFQDSYTNLTYKVMMGLKWMTLYCPSAKYVVKVDQDMFLHVPNLVNYLRGVYDPDPGIVVGYINAKARVLRTGKWGLSPNLFPLTSYPNYTNGNSYVISGKAAGKMLEAAEHMPYIFIEDAFLTGIVRTVVGLKIIDHQGFARWSDRPPRLCSFHNTFRIAATNTKDDLKRSLWKAQKYPNLRNCYDEVKRDKV